MIAEVVADPTTQLFTGPRLIELPRAALPIPCPEPGFFSLAVLLRHLRSIPNLPGVGESIARRAATRAIQRGWRTRYPYADQDAPLGRGDIQAMVCSHTWATSFYTGDHETTDVAHQKSLEEMSVNGDYAGISAKLDWDMSPDGRGTIVEHSLAFLAAAIPEAEQP